MKYDFQQIEKLCFAVFWKEYPECYLVKNLNDELIFNNKRQKRKRQIKS